jgi:hypothetical protein
MLRKAVGSRRARGSSEQVRGRLVAEIADLATVIRSLYETSAISYSNACGQPEFQSNFSPCDRVRAYPNRPRCLCLPIKLNHTGLFCCGFWRL